MAQTYSNLAATIEILRAASALAGKVATEGYELEDAVEESRTELLTEFTPSVGGGAAAERIEAERASHTLRVDIIVAIAQAAIAGSGAADACVVLGDAATAAAAQEETVRRLVDRERDQDHPIDA